MDKNDADRFDPGRFLDWDIEDSVAEDVPSAAAPDSSDRVETTRSGDDVSRPEGGISVDDLEIEEDPSPIQRGGGTHEAVLPDTSSIPTAESVSVATASPADGPDRSDISTSLQNDLPGVVLLSEDLRLENEEDDSSPSLPGSLRAEGSESLSKRSEASSRETQVQGPKVDAGSSLQGDVVPRYEDFVFVSREGRFLFSGSSIRHLDENAVITSYCPVVVDFFDSPGPGVLSVEGGHKYAPILGRRKLQNQGELTDEFDLVTLQNQKESKSRSSLFYQVVPRAEKARLERECESSPQGFLLHDSVTMLAGMLRRMQQKGPVALALRLPRAVLVVAGDRKRCVWARRYVLADEDMSSLVDSLGGIVQDLLAVSRESGLNVSNVLWIESLTDAPCFPDEQFDGVSFSRSPVFALRMDDTGDVRYSSMPGLMDRISDSTALTGGVERNLVRLGTWEKWILGSLFVFACMLGSAAWWLHSQSIGLELQNKELAHQGRRLKDEYASLSAQVGFTSKDSQRVERAAHVATDLQRVGQSVPLAGVWNGLAGLRPEPCRIQALEVSYLDTAVRVRVEGVVDLGLTQAQAAYTSFLEALKQDGFVIKKQSFKLDVDSNFFSMILEKPFTG